MALEKVSEIGSIDVMKDGVIQVRRDDLILDNGVQVARTIHRHVLSPGDDLTNEDARVSSVAGAVWTPAVIQAWQDFINS